MFGGWGPSSLFSSPEPQGNHVNHDSATVRRRSFTLFKHFLKNRLANQCKFHKESPWVEGTKVCSRHLGHMTKMAATPYIWYKPFKIVFSETTGPILTKLGM